ncbi:MAG: hypothetical protein KGJ07_00550 [Patescibacteria group bacterium]|nr:hypothetical protein [Patescibacteria group bacterium]
MIFSLVGFAAWITSKRKRANIGDCKMSLPDTVKLVRSVYFGATCKDCKGERIVLFSTEGLAQQINLAKCLDCGTFGVLCENKETQNGIIIFTEILIALGLVNYEIPTDLIEFYQRAMKARLNHQ